MPLLYAGVDKQIDVIIDEKVPFVFTSAGNPATWTSTLKQQGIKVIHVISSSRFAKKAEDCGCDADSLLKALEAGGAYNQRKPPLVLIPLICDAIKIPAIAAGASPQAVKCLLL